MHRLGQSRRALLCALTVSCVVPSARAQTLGLNVTRGGSDPSHLVNAGARLFFSAATDSGFAILRFDTATETRSAIDTPVFLEAPTDLAVVGSRLFFSAAAAGALDGPELWVTDGTTTTLLQVRPLDDEDPGIAEAVAVNGLLVFVADDGVRGRELWVSNGTPEGTVVLKDIHPAGASDPSRLTVVNATVFFQANDGVHGAELWQSDGTTAGTRMVADIDPGAFGSNPVWLERAGSVVFFSADDGVRGKELWRSDGVTTTLLFDIEPIGGVGSNPSYMTLHDGWIYFAATTTAFGTELYRTDGAIAEILEVVPGPSGGDPNFLTSAGSELYFVADDGVHGRELWASNGTPAGTRMVEDITPGPSGTSSFGATIEYDDTLFFTPNVAGDRELWRSGGTAALTFKVFDLWNDGSSAPEWMCVNGAHLYFSADDGSDAGRELFRTAGSFIDTERIWDVYAERGSKPEALRYWNSGSEEYYLATVELPGEGRELVALDHLVYDGSPEVHPLGIAFDALPGVVPDMELVTSGHRIHYTSFDEQHGAEAILVDTSQPFPEFLPYPQDVIPGPASSFPRNLCVLDGWCLFGARSSSAPAYGLYAMSIPSPILVHAFGAERPRDLVALDEPATAPDVALFVGYEPASGWELWATDATTAWQAIDIAPGAASSAPEFLVRVDDQIFFTAVRADVGRELWVSDGTEGGTRLVDDLEPGPVGSNPRELVAGDGVLYFSANALGTGRELYRATSTEVSSLPEIVPGPGSASPLDLTYVPDDLYFTADAGTGEGREPWVHDGSSVRSLGDLWPGPDSSSPSDFLGHRNLCFFVAENPTVGRELWRTDSFDSEVVSDAIAPGAVSSFPSDLTRDRDWVFFVAETPDLGREIWYVEEGGLAAVDDHDALDGPSPVVQPGRVRIWPSPVRDVASLWVRIPGAGAVVAQLIDVSGRVVATRTFESVSAGTQSLAWDVRADRVGPGIYFVRVESVGGQAWGRMVVIG